MRGTPGTPSLRLRYARKALTIDPHAIDAFVLLALDAATSAERIALLREACASARSSGAPCSSGRREGFFWVELDARPYMRAIIIWRSPCGTAVKGRKQSP